jgi:hypothetical protein
VPGAFQERGQRTDVVGSENHINPGGLLDDGCLVLLS